MVWSPLAGQLHRLWPARRVMLLGAGLFAAGAVLAASARSPAMLGAALAGPLAAGAIAAGALTVNTLVTRWFVARRGRALGIALRQQQIDVQTAAWLMSAMTASAIAGKLLVGWAADRMRLLPLFAIVIACHLVLLAVLSLTAAVPVLFITVLTVGLALGGVFPLWSLLIASRFEPREFPLAYGTSAVITTAATMAMVEVAGRLFDGAGSYRPVWLLLAALATLSLTIAIIVLRRDAAPLRAVTTSG